eukprot:1153968-Pelagomonas_calceolata.AAC.4
MFVELCACGKLSFCKKDSCKRELLLVFAVQSRDVVEFLYFDHFHQPHRVTNAAGKASGLVSNGWSCCKGLRNEQGVQQQLG